eukprot:3009132-Prymnesium_polylepis.1
MIVPMIPSPPTEPVLTCVAVFYLRGRLGPHTRLSQICALSQEVSDPRSFGTDVTRTSARSDRATSRPGDGACRLPSEVLTKIFCRHNHIC